MQKILLLCHFIYIIIILIIIIYITKYCQCKCNCKEKFIDDELSLYNKPTVSAIIEEAKNKGLSPLETVQYLIEVRS